MAVIVLMYHHTPDGAPEGFYDVGLSTFRDQIAALQDDGVSFIKFSDCGKPEYVGRGTYVALTFDDGHATNEAAFRVLADRGLTPTAFVVRDWSTRDARYLSARALGDLKHVCELGGHGATHRALTSLSDAELAQELAASRDYVETIAGAPATTMALPGGHGAQRELAAAERARFRLVGNSCPMPHSHTGISVNRICVNRTHDARQPLRWAQASSLHWTLRRARFAATATGRRLMGGKLYGALSALAK
jgi:peptidoglycan/xylan/chitin deacetylase (PgdA/CDA1 family)